MACCEVERIVTRGTDPHYPRRATVGVSIACQTSDTNPIAVESNNPTPKVTLHRSMSRKRIGVLCEEQSGFREGHSTVTTVTYVTDFTYKHMDQGQLTGAVFLDLKKAYLIL